MEIERQAGLKRMLHIVKEFLRGMIMHEPAMVALKEKVAMEHLMILTLFGDMIGLPVTNHYYALRLLPYIYPRIEGWKRSLLREKDWSDWAFD